MTEAELFELLGRLFVEAQMLRRELAKLQQAAVAKAAEEKKQPEN
jgi:hypothetical protein